MKHDYYKEYYDLERNHWWFVARETIIKNYINKFCKKNKLSIKNLNILNVGCSTGRSSEYLSEFGQVTSIEYDEFCCEFTADKTGLKIIHGSITALPFENETFDLVCAFDVIEHVEDDLLAVNELKRVAKNNSHILITVPAFMSLWSHHDVVNHHFKRYQIYEITKLFHAEQNGRTVFASYFNFLLFIPIYGFRKLSNLLKFGEKREGAGSDFESYNNGTFNYLLKQIMKLDSIFINRSIKLPFGVSIIYSYTKN